MAIRDKIVTLGYELTQQALQDGSVVVLLRVTLFAVEKARFGSLVEQKVFDDDRCKNCLA